MKQQEVDNRWIGSVILFGIVSFIFYHLVKWVTLGAYNQCTHKYDLLSGDAEIGLILLMVIFLLCALLVSIPLYFHYKCDYKYHRIESDKVVESHSNKSFGKFIPALLFFTAIAISIIIAYKNS